MNHPTAELPLSLYYASARVCLAFDRVLGDRCGISFEDFALLQLLVDEDSATIDELRSGLGASRAVLLQRVRPLEKIGLVEAEGDLANRRFRLSNAGKRTMTTARQSIDENGEDLFASIDVGGCVESLKALATQV